MKGLCCPATGDAMPRTDWSFIVLEFALGGWF